MRRAARYLGTDFFTLLARLDRGEWHWLNWAAVAQGAEIAAFGMEWPPAQVVGTVALAPKRDEG